MFSTSARTLLQVHNAYSLLRHVSAGELRRQVQDVVDELHGVASAHAHAASGTFTSDIDDPGMEPDPLMSEDPWAAAPEAPNVDPL